MCCADACGCASLHLQAEKLDRVHAFIPRTVKESNGIHHQFYFLLGIGIHLPGPTRNLLRTPATILQTPEPDLSPAMTARTASRGVLEPGREPPRKLRAVEGAPGHTSLDVGGGAAKSTRGRSVSLRSRSISRASRADCVPALWMYSEGPWAHWAR